MHYWGVTYVPICLEIFLFSAKVAQTYTSATANIKYSSKSGLVK